MSVDEHLKTASDLSESELEYLSREFSLLRVRRRVPSMLSEQETAPFLRINQGVPEAMTYGRSSTIKAE